MKSKSSDVLLSQCSVTKHPKTKTSSHLSSSQTCSLARVQSGGSPQFHVHQLGWLDLEGPLSGGFTHSSSSYSKTQKASSLSPGQTYCSRDSSLWLFPHFPYLPNQLCAVDSSSWGFWREPA